MSLKAIRCEIASLKSLFQRETREELDRLSALDLSYQSIPEFPEFHIWALFGSLQSLSFAHCELYRVPADTLVRGLPTLRSLDLSHNNFTSVRDFVPFGRLKKLETLDFQGNPIPFIELRVPLIRDLLFPAKYARIKLVKYLVGEYLSPTAKARTGTMKAKRRLKDVLYVKRKPAGVPRDGSFPMLEILNGLQITEDEVASAKPYNDSDIIDRSVQTPTLNNSFVGSRMKNRVSVHPCLVRKERVQSVPRFVKIPEFFGDATLHSVHSKAPSFIFDPKNRHRVHKATHMELDFRIRKRSAMRLKRSLPQDSTELPPSGPPSAANEEDTVRKA